MQIAIDGPTGAGKTSVARALAKHFSCLLVSTGAMYRAVALELSRGLKLAEINIDVLPDERILLNDEDVTEQLYTPQMDELSSQTATRPEVREFLIARQHQIAQSQDVVMEGRDITTVVLPHADVKIFLDASPEERARRRCQQRKEPYEVVLQKVRERDVRDGTGFGRLQLTPETIVLSTDGKNLEAVISEVINTVEQALQKRKASGRLTQ